MLVFGEEVGGGGAGELAQLVIALATKTTDPNLRL